MSEVLTSLRLDGANTDSLGNYLMGTGILAAASQRWPAIRGCWRDGHFLLLASGLSFEDVKGFLLNDWTPTNYQRWWSGAQKRDTKAKSSLGLWHARNDQSLEQIRLLDAHIVAAGRNRFNPVLGTGGNIGKRNLEKAWNDALKLRSKPESAQWLDTTLLGSNSAAVPDFASGGTWFVFANKTFNSGQAWFREGQLSPWSQLLAMEGAFLLVGSVNRRLGSRPRPYAVFPFISEPSQPEAPGEIGMSRAEFWAPLWSYPATLAEVRSLFQRGLARLGGRPAQAPHEFAVAAMCAGVDGGISEFVRYELRQTTSSQVYEAIPRERVSVGRTDRSRPPEDASSHPSQLFAPLINSGWLDRLPYEPRDAKQKGKFIGLRGPIESAIIKVAQDGTEPEPWRELMLRLAAAQSRIDRNKSLREQCPVLPLLADDWLEKAWHEHPAEIEVACAVASVGWTEKPSSSNLPLLVNVFGVDLHQRAGKLSAAFPKARPARAVWASGQPLNTLLDVAQRRLVDADCSTMNPFCGTRPCSLDTIAAFLRGDESLDLELVVKWVPPLALIDWTETESAPRAHRERQSSAATLDGTAILHSLMRPLFHKREERDKAKRLFPETLAANAVLLRRLFNLLRFNAIDEAIQIAREHYMAAGIATIAPPNGITANGEVVAAALVIPMFEQDVALGIKRWRQPAKNNH